jgi:quercetin dioxygenase-like cupin family protein
MDAQKNYKLIPSLLDLIPEVSEDSIISRTIHKEGKVNAVLFAFDAGQALSEHRSAYSAVIQILEGKARLSLGTDTYELEEGAWLVMPPELEHSVYAQTTMKMLLLILG